MSLLKDGNRRQILVQVETDFVIYTINSKTIFWLLRKLKFGIQAYTEYRILGTSGNISFYTYILITCIALRNYLDGGPLKSFYTWFAEEVTE